MAPKMKKVEKEGGKKKEMIEKHERVIVAESSTEISINAANTSCYKKIEIQSEEVTVKFNMDSHGNRCSCSAHHTIPSVHQTLQEMDFERGIWSAALDGDLDRVQSFIKKGTDPNMKDQAGYSALHYAARAGHHAVCKFLLDHGACVNSQTRGGTTALHRAAYRGHLGIIRLLLEHNADPSLTDDDGSTALHKAAEQNHVDVCKLLVSRCSLIRTVKDKRSRLPVDLCPVSTTLKEILKPPL